MTLIEWDEAWARESRLYENSPRENGAALDARANIMAWFRRGRAAAERGDREAEEAAIAVLRYRGSLSTPSTARR